MNREISKKEGILIYCGFPFPIGLSGTNRLISYSRGLVELGYKVKIQCVFPTEKASNIFNYKHKGEYLGIIFEYSLKNTIWPTKKILRYFKGFFSIVVFLFKLTFKNPLNEFSIIISSYDGVLINLFVGLIAKFKRQKLVLIVDEFPKHIRYEYKRKPIINSLLENVTLKLYDGFISMTNILANFYKNKLKTNCKCLILPMTVEIDRFENLSKKKLVKKSITYIGELGNNKDGVDDLIYSFSLVVKEMDVILIIIGDSIKKEDIFKLKNKVKTLNIEEKVHFLGRIDRNKVPQMLMNSSVLALARPKSKRAEGGFPTKLGEYLATGVPVVVTKVGEIPLYLTDRQSAFLAEPDNPEHFAKKIIEALSDYEFAKKVGENGRQIALRVFNSKIQSKNLYLFLKNLNS